MRQSVCLHHASAHTRLSDSDHLFACPSASDGTYDCAADILRSLAAHECWEPLAFGMQAANLDSAVTAALLLLPAAFSSVDLFSVICGLSYMADIRMAFAEDSRKVGTIMLHPLQTLDACAQHISRLSWWRAR